MRRSESSWGGSTTVVLRVDRSRCVLCGGPNGCVMAGGAGGGADERCWCVDLEFPAALTQRAETIDGGASCICRHCVEGAD